MSRRFLVDIDLNGNQLLNARLQNLAAAAGSPQPGNVYFDTVLGASYVWNGTAWVSNDASKLSGTIPNTALATNPLTRANHTGTQLSATISDLAATVQGYRLNQFAVPTANIPMGGFTLTGLATPTASGQAAEYTWVIGQVQSAAAGIASKPPVAAVATANITLSGLQAIDGYTTVAADRVLVTGQTTASQNGIYNAAAGAWTRTTIDGAGAGEIETGAMWFVQNGTVNSATQWRVSTTGAITVGTTSLTIVQFGAASVYTASNGILLTGANFTTQVVAAGGVLAGAGGLSVDTTVVARKFTSVIGDGSATAIVVTHNLNTQNVVMQVRQATTPFGTVECDMAATSVNTATFTFVTAPTAGQYSATIIG